MSKSIHNITPAVSVIGTLLIGGWLVIIFGLASNNDAAASFSIAQTADKSQGNSEQGRVFNGKGICYYCHGIDGDMNKRPQLNSTTNEIIERLKPKPANLRDPSSLKRRTDDERFQLIREGHIETGMFPDKVLTDEEIKDVLAYLLELRGNAALQGTPK